MRKIAFLLYPAVVLGLVLWIVPKESHAGVVRKLTLSPNQPAVVNLAFDNATALSFTVKPERVVRGSPTGVQIEFLGNDLIVSPLTRTPGNLHIYTKSDHYTVLFRVVAGTAYDDSVQVTFGYSGAARAIRLLEDSYHPETLKIKALSRDRGNESEVPALISMSEKAIFSEELKEALSSYVTLKCEHCVIRRDPKQLKIVCEDKIERIHCRSSNATAIDIIRRRP